LVSCWSCRPNAGANVVFHFSLPKKSQCFFTHRVILLIFNSNLSKSLSD
jgi:hypothetical protein